MIIAITNRAGGYKQCHSNNKKAHMIHVSLNLLNENLCPTLLLDKISDDRDFNHLAIVCLNTPINTNKPDKYWYTRQDQSPSECDAENSVDDSNNEGLSIMCPKERTFLFIFHQKDDN